MTGEDYRYHHKRYAHAIDDEDATNDDESSIPYMSDEERPRRLEGTTGHRPPEGGKNLARTL